LKEDEWKLVPTRVTDEMLAAWFSAPRGLPFCSSRQYFQNCYAALIAAAPSPQMRAAPLPPDDGA
jgi:hypothetical protein